MTEHQHNHREERRGLGWRERRGGTLWGLLLAAIGGFWLTNNLTNNAVSIAENPGRVVFPALVILLGVAAMFAKRDRR
jgi:hypothetical protein